MQIILLSSCVQIQSRLLSLHTPKKRQIILSPVPQPTGTPPCDPAFFRFPLEVQLGIRSVPQFKQWQAELLWCKCCRIIISWDTMAFLLFAVQKLLWPDNQANGIWQGFGVGFRTHLPMHIGGLDFLAPLFHCIHWVFSGIMYWTSQQWESLLCFYYLRFLP